MFARITILVIVTLATVAGVAVMAAVVAVFAASAVSLKKYTRSSAYTRSLGLFAGGVPAMLVLAACYSRRQRDAWRRASLGAPTFERVTTRILTY